jgi:hypothetical protein
LSAVSPFTAIFAPSVADDPRFRAWFAQFRRLSASPTAAIELLRIFTLIDIRAALPTISVPTLALNPTDDPLVEAAHRRVGAGNLVRRAHAASLYSWMRPSRLGESAQSRSDLRGRGR